MINLKKMNLLTLSIVLFTGMSLLTGCAQDETQIQRYAWPLATASPQDTVTQLFAEKFSQEVEDLSKGRMKIQVYPNSTLGGDRELLESCRSGDIPFVIQNTAPQVSFMPEISIFDLPCAFDDIESARKAVDNPVFYAMIEKVYEASGYRILGYADQGFRVMSTNRKIENIEDFRGLKIRTMENPNHIKFWKSINSNPTPMSFNEVYVGLQQGTIDAQENPYEVISSSRLYEQQKYVVQTNHMPHLISLIVSDEFYEDLSKEQQDIITEAAETAKEFARTASDQRINEKINIIKSSGTEIIKLSEDTQKALKKAAQSTYDDIKSQSGENLYNAYLKQD